MCLPGPVGDLGATRGVFSLVPEETFAGEMQVERDEPVVVTSTLALGGGESCALEFRDETRLFDENKFRMKFLCVSFLDGCWYS
jgi:hypothetical protein